MGVPADRPPLSAKAVPHRRSVLSHFNRSQIFNLDTKAKLKSMQFAEPVVFWKWVSATKLGLVTATAVYHWDIDVRRGAEGMQGANVGARQEASGSRGDAGGQCGRRHSSAEGHGRGGQ